MGGPDGVAVALAPHLFSPFYSFWNPVHRMVPVTLKVDIPTSVNPVQNSLRHSQECGFHGDSKNSQVDKMNHQAIQYASVLGPVPPTPLLSPVEESHRMTFLPIQVELTQLSVPMLFLEGQGWHLSQLSLRFPLLQLLEGRNHMCAH